MTPVRPVSEEDVRPPDRVQHVGGKVPPPESVQPDRELVPAVEEDVRLRGMDRRVRPVIGMEGDVRQSLGGRPLMGMNVQPLAGVYPGNAGSPYPKLLTFSALAAGTYTFTEANFAGLGAYLPGLAEVCLGPAAGGTAIISITTDGGTTWKNILNTAGTAAAGSVTTGGAMLLLDGAGGLRLVIATQACDVFIFPIGMP